MRPVKFILLAVIIIILSMNNIYAITLTVDPTTKQIDLGGVALDSGFYGGTAGNILLTVAGKTNGIPAELYTNIDNLLTNQDDNTFQIPDGQLTWKIYWASTDSTAYTGVDSTSSSGFNNWVGYNVRTDDRILLINPGTVNPVSITLGTQLIRVPAVMPAGKYTTRVVYTVTE